MHPKRALLLVDPSLALRVFADGVEAVALDAFGAALLGHASLAAFRGACVRGRGEVATTALRAFLAAFDQNGAAADDALLAGALGFDAHRLATPAATGVASLGVFFFSPRTYQRDDAGDWWCVTLTFDDESLARAAAMPRARGSPGSTEARLATTEEVARDDFPLTCCARAWLNGTSFCMTS